jgi:hypothetical protein
MKMRALEELIDTKDPAWPEVQKWVAASKGRGVILSGDRAKGERTLYALQVTTHSTLGAIAFETGGVLVDHGWLRILGSGSAKLPESLASWNGLAGDSIGSSPYLVVAYDVVGGLFALDGGRLVGKPGKVAYFAPDSLAWEGTELGYSDWLQWALAGDLAKFYETMRWKGWEKEVAALSGDQGVSIWPPPWTREGQTASPSRKAVPIRQLVDLEMETRRQLDKHGAKRSP